MGLVDAEALQYGIPLVMQIMLMVVLMSTGQWMVGLMLGSGTVGAAIPWILRMRHRIREEQARGGKGLGGKDISDIGGIGGIAGIAGDVQTSRTFDGHGRRRDGRGPSVALDAESLERLIDCDADDPSAAWRGVVHRWLREPTLKVPVAVDAHGPYTIDLGLQGPHALVAGTTGSGKSVLLQSWCLAMAAYNSPEHLRFVFMDFKGGSTFNALARLPHTVGNVCDLDLHHSIRALIALERELKRREGLAAHHGAGRAGSAAGRDPELIVVIDEFHALKDQLPDYVDRLVRIASLGRSLGMHIIACTQNPMGQVSANMKANMSLKLCLRVLDALQSNELLGTPAAAAISPKSPGTAICNDGERHDTIRCAVTTHVTSLVASMIRAHRFMGIPTPHALFTPPLPARITRDDYERKRPSANRMPIADDGRRPSAVVIGVADDSVTFEDAELPSAHGDIAIIGPKGRGKSTLLGTLDRELTRLGRRTAWLHAASAEPRYTASTETASAEVVSTEVTSTAVTSTAATSTDIDDVDDVNSSDTATTGPRRGRVHGDAPDGHMRTVETDGAQPNAYGAQPDADVWFVDDADTLLDPLCIDPMAHRLRTLLQRPETTVVFCIETSRHVLTARRCATRIVFPTGDRATDLADGIDMRLLHSSDSRDHTMPGRAVLIHAGTARLIQCFAPSRRAIPRSAPRRREKQDELPPGS